MHAHDDQRQQDEDGQRPDQNRPGRHAIADPIPKADFDQLQAAQNSNPGLPRSAVRPEGHPSQNAQQGRCQGQGCQQGNPQAQGDGRARVAHLGKLRNRHEAQADHHGAGTCRQRFSDAPHAGRDRCDSFLAVLQLLAVAADEEQAIIGARAIKDHDGKYLAHVDQVYPRHQRHMTLMPGVHLVNMSGMRARSGAR